MELFKFVVFVGFLTVATGQEVLLNLGGIFNPNNPDDETAFTYIIDTINREHEGSTIKFNALTTPEPDNSPIKCIHATCNLLKDGVAAIFAELNNRANRIAVESLCDTKEIPLFESGWNGNPPRSTSAVSFHPSNNVLAELFLEMIDYFNWNDFIVLYEDNDSLLRLGQFLKGVDAKRFKQILVERLDPTDEGNYRTVLKKIWKTEVKNVLIDCSTETLEMLFLQAQQIGLLTSQYSYIVTNADMHIIDMEPYMYSETNITGIRFIKPADQNIVRLSEELNQFTNTTNFSDGHIKLSTALMLDAVRVFSDAVYSLQNIETTPMDCNSNDDFQQGYTLINKIRTDIHHGLTGVIKFDEEGYRTDFSVELIQLFEDGLQVIGTWNTSSRLQMLPQPPEAILLDDSQLVNRTFIVLTTLTSPYGMLKESETQLYGNEQYEGFGIDLIEEMAALTGFNYTFILQEDKKNGVKDLVTGRWSGMIGRLIDGEADLAITDLTITSEREEAVDFTTPFMNLGISILYQKPKKAPPSFFSFAAPFGVEVWVTLAAAFFAVSISLFIIGRFCPEEWTNPYPCIEEPDFLVNQFTLRNALWFTTGAIMQQGSEIAPIGISTRLVAGVWWFFTLIMVSSYTANLAAFLTTENPDAHFTNVDELVERADKIGIRYGAKAGGATANFFIHSNNSLYKQIGEHMQAHKDEMVNENKEGVALAEKGNYAFFMESTSIEYETQRKCDLKQVGDLLDNKGYGIAMRKDSSYRTALSTAILKLQANGRIRDLKRKWWEERHGGGQCSEGDEELEAVPLNLKSVEGVFYVTAYGMVLACLFVVIEMILHNAKIAIQDKRSLKRALREEFKFYLKFGENVKPVTSEDDDEQVGDEENKDSPPPIGFVLDDVHKSEHNSEEARNGFVFDGNKSSDESGRSKSKKSTLHSNGRSNTQST